MPERTTPPGRPLRDSESREVIEEAWKLQDEAERHADADRRTRELAAAGAEVGLEGEHLPLAEGLVRARVEERARRDVMRKFRLRCGIAGAIGAAVLVGGMLAILPTLTRPAPAFEPWSTDFAAAGAEWQLEVSPGSEATLTWSEGGEGQGTVAEVAVERLTPMADGRYWVNLDSRAHPEWAGATRVSFSTQGGGEGLDHVRLYLETPTERWRGPKLDVKQGHHALALTERAGFERQEKVGDQWEVAAWEPPGRVDTVSFKFGWYVNEPGDRGTIQVDDLRVE